jgi:2-polyprenyl-6-methoxyphenol hydroxylase-like FAD-dependent oxidoreductase
MYEHAIVLGGSITGLATARVLSRRFARVTVVERDCLSDGPEFRAGVPQGRQVHVLLRRGQDLLEELFPGVAGELRAAGAESLRWGRDVRWFHFGGWKQPNDSSFESLSGSRLLLESLLRARLRSAANVTMLDGATVDGLRVEGGAARGVHVVGRGDLDGDLIVDATGRESKAASWLEALGLERPAEQEVNAHLGYATRVYREPPGRRDWRGLLIHPTPPSHTRLAAIFPIEGGRWHVVLSGVNRDYPPSDEEGFLEFARNLASPELYEAIRDAEPLSAIHGYRRTSNRLRRYDRIRRPLRRFVALGDAVCAFNPVYGQGMTTGTIGAMLLGDCVDRAPLDELAPRFQKSLQRRLILPWFLATSEDLRYPETEGSTMSAPVRTLQRGLDHIIRRTVVDRRAYDAFLSVMHMTRGPEALLTPAALRSILRRAPNDPPAEAAPPAREELRAAAGG